MCIFVDSCFDDVVEHPKRKGQVGSQIFETTGLFLKQVLDYLYADCSHDHGCGCSDGRDNLAGYQLHLEVVGLVDSVVSCLRLTKWYSEVGNATDKLNMIIGRIVLLKLYSICF